MNSKDDTSYIDQKGRTRWRRNDEIAEKLQQLHDILVIGGYEESHAARYPRLAYAISRHPESIVELHRGGCLSTISGVGETIAEIIGEFIETGYMHEVGGICRTHAENCAGIDGDSQTWHQDRKDALYDELDIDSLASLSEALDEGKLEGFKGIGKKMLETIRQHINENLK